MYVDTQSVYAFSQFFVFNMKFSRKIPLLACRPSPKSKYTYTRLFSPQRPRKRCSRRKTTHTTAALWGYRLTAPHVVGLAPDVVFFLSSSCSLVLLPSKIQNPASLTSQEKNVFSILKNTASFKTKHVFFDGLVSCWFVAHDFFLDPVCKIHLIIDTLTFTQKD